jgi:hypothetical protein
VDSPGIVAELYVLGDVGPGSLPCRVDRTVNTLVLQRAEERFGHGVIVAYPGSTYRLPGPVFREGRGEAAGGVVAAPIGVEDRVVGERHVTCSHADGLDDERCLVVIVHRVADDLLGVAVDDGGQVQPPFPRRDIGDVCVPRTQRARLR